MDSELNINISFQSDTAQIIIETFEDLNQLFENAIAELSPHEYSHLTDEIERAIEESILLRVNDSSVNFIL